MIAPLHNTDSIKLQILFSMIIFHLLLLLKGRTQDIFSGGGGGGQLEEIFFVTKIENLQDIF